MSSFPVPERWIAVLAFRSLIIVVLIAALAVQGGTVTYEVVDYPAESGSRTVAAGTVAQKDFKVLASRYKGVALTDDLMIQVGCPPPGAVAGFAVIVGPGFSWEWFDRVQGDVFRKRQESGSLRVRTTTDEASPQLLEVEFLSDVSLRSFRIVGEGKKRRHEIARRVNIRKGSVFTFTRSTE